MVCSARRSVYVASRGMCCASPQKDTSQGRTRNDLYVN